MKFLVILCLISVAFAAPQLNPSRQRPEIRKEPFWRILRSEISPVIGPNFHYLYETENKIFEERTGREGSKGQSNMQGNYRFETPEGEVIEVRYIADENGFQPESSAIPTPHPMPAHALEQIRIAAEQRAQGIRWDERGFRINK